MHTKNGNRAHITHTSSKNLSPATFHHATDEKDQSCYLQAKMPRFAKKNDSTGQGNHLGKLPSLPIQPMSPTNGQENPRQHTLTPIMKQVPVCIPDSIIAQSSKKNIEASSQVCPQTLFAAKKITLPAQQITNLSNKSWNWDVRRLISREGRLGAPGGIGPSRICFLFR